ncbi:MAG: hypothetical protein QXH20_06150 [Candidatus Bathyarchaeia archaeon]
MEMVRRWILMVGILSVMAAWAMSQTSVMVKGTLKGYFLSPNGNLSVCEVPFSFPDEPFSPDLPKSLFPLWAGYYLQGRFSSEKPIQSIWLLSGNGRLLWRRHYPEGVAEGTVPYQEGGWVGVKGQDGLSVKLLVRFDDGSEMVVRPHFPVYFEKVLPLKVDWLDFIRIAEIANLLKAKGKEVWKGFTLEGIPFLLEGDKGQWVLVNHPKPPKGFVRYEGPLPKVPFKMEVYVGEGRERVGRRDELGGWAGKVNGIWTASLRYFPNWWVLEECAPLGYSVIREPDAVYRLESIIHEAFHVWWFQRFKEPQWLSKKEVHDPSLEIRERECLVKALTASSDDEARQWAKAFLLAREERRKKQGMTQAQVHDERLKETIEGLATFVSWKALEVGSKGHYQPLPEAKADKMFGGYRSKDMRMLLENLQLISHHSLGDDHAFGLAQAFLLERWNKGWVWEIERSNLEALLGKEANSVTPPKGWLGSQGYDDTMSTQGQTEEQEQMEEVERPERFTIIWLPLPKPLIQEVKRVKGSLGEPLPDFSFETDLLTALIEGPFWAEVDERHNRLGILWEEGRQLSVLQNIDGTVVLTGERLKVKGKFGLSKDKSGVHVHPNEKMQKTTKGSASTMLRKKNLAFVLLPVLLCVGGGINAQETITSITGELSGLFHSATGSFAYETLPLTGSTPDGAERYFVTDETYMGSLVFCHADAPPFQLTFWVILSWTGVEGGGSYWTAMGAAIDTRGGELLDFAPSLSPASQPQESKELSIRVKYRDAKGREYEIELKFKTVKTPPLSSVSIGAGLYDAESGETSPIGVAGYIYRKAEPDKKTGFSNMNNPSQPAIVNLAPAQDYTVVATGRTPIPGVCAVPLISSPDPVGVMANTGGSAGFLFIRHKPIKGRVMEQTSNGQIPLSGAKASLWKGDKKVSSDWESNSLGYFEIPPYQIDTALAQHGSGIYTVKVEPPARSMRRPKPLEPLEAKKDVSLTKCERKKSEDPCPRSLTMDVGTFVFIYEPAGPGGQ